jgi:hypothetical protein
VRCLADVSCGGKQELPNILLLEICNGYRCRRITLLISLLDPVLHLAEQLIGRRDFPSMNRSVAAISRILGRKQFGNCAVSGWNRRITTGTKTGTKNVEPGWRLLAVVENCSLDSRGWYC